MNVTVLALNVWNYRGDWRARRERIARVIREAAPDVVALQEVRRDPRHALGVNQAAQLARRTGLRAVYAPAMRYWRLPRVEEGLAVLTPHRVIHHFAVPLRWDRHDPTDPNRRIALRARIALPGGDPLDCWVTHLSLDAPSRERSIARLRDIILNNPSLLPPLLMGDLNARPDDPALQPLRDAGLCDLWPIAHPDDPGGTYPADAPHERIDYLFAGVGWHVESLERIGVGADALSDHCGLLARLTYER